jgi:hypothetical protein
MTLLWNNGAIARYSGNSTDSEKRRIASHRELRVTRYLKPCLDVIFYGGAFSPMYQLISLVDQLLRASHIDIVGISDLRYSIA